MAAQCYEEEMDEPYPEGYLEALEECKTLAADLLQKMWAGAK